MIAGVNVKFLIPGRLSDKNRPTLLMDVQNRLEYDNFSRGVGGAYRSGFSCKLRPGAICNCSTKFIVSDDIPGSSTGALEG